MMAHGTAVQAYRATGRNQIGLVVNIEPKYPASHDEADVAATRRADAYMNRQFLEPALRGTYPEELPGIFGQAWTPRSASDLETIHQPLDYIGVNYYTRSVVRADRNCVAAAYGGCSPGEVDSTPKPAGKFFRRD